MPMQHVALYLYVCALKRIVESTPARHPPLTQLCATKDARAMELGSSCSSSPSRSSSPSSSCSSNSMAAISTAWMQQRFAANTQLGQRHHHYINA
ncbi:hypothetical protein AWZ03_009811 [Drosophila navojoa]|uniref:Uncharacterized protein n=1 Tax=Drosophila navojoa TaxID=7232 RepID=A0A484B506_DRONA|nr:hypothetical protein AWZ03_009811 [Drosophila navojoa]